MKITVFTPRSEFSSKNQQRLSKLGKIVYTHDRKECPLNELIKLSSGSSIIAVDPDNFGGFEKAKDVVTKVSENLSDLKGVALSTTSTEWINLNFFKKRKIEVTNIPHYSTESVAEHTIGLMICLAKNIIINDREYWSDKESKYDSGPGFELKGKTLGVIGLGDIGSRVAELGLAMGMKVLAYNRSPKKQKGVTMKKLENILSESDVISIHLECNKETFHFIAKKEIQKMKDGIIITDLIGPISPDQEVVDKKEMALALRKGKVRFYAYEAEDLVNNPLSKIKNAIGLKGFSWYTTDALDRAKNIWVDNIEALAIGKPINTVNL